MASGRTQRKINKGNKKRQHPSKQSNFKREITRRRTRRHNLRINSRAKK